MAATELRDRWATPEGRRLASAVLPRLLAGEPLDGLAVGMHEGRWDLRGMVTPRDVFGTPEPWLDAFVDRVERNFQVRGGAWARLDLSGGDLTGLRFLDTEFRECRFDNANCQAWDTRAISAFDTSFHRTDLRRANLGGWYDGRWGRFERVDFARANCGLINASSADFIDCDFSGARLNRYESGSASFVRCRFSGVLNGVIFADRHELLPKPYANGMEDIDFAGAEFRWCEFHNFDLKRVILPSREKHLIFRRPRDVMTLALARMGTPEGAALSRLGMCGYVEASMGHLHPDCDVQFLSYHTLREMGDGTEVVREFFEGIVRELNAFA